VFIRGLVWGREENRIFKAEWAFSHKRCKVVLSEPLLLLILLRCFYLLLNWLWGLQTFLIEDWKCQVRYTFVATLGRCTVWETRKVVNWLLVWRIKLAHNECLQASKFMASVLLQLLRFFINAWVSHWTFRIGF
jgi:hypothetical protein